MLVEGICETFVINDIISLSHDYKGSSFFVSVRHTLSDYIQEMRIIRQDWINAQFDWPSHCHLYFVDLFKVPIVVNYSTVSLDSISVLRHCVKIALKIVPCERCIV